MPRRAIILLSGGLDSTVAAALAKERYSEIHAISFDYGQRHARELRSATAVASALGLQSHTTFRLDIARLGGSALTHPDLNVPKGRSMQAMTQGVPVTFVPGRNTIFLAHALAAAEVHEADAVVIGANAMDHAGYPDCRPDYLAAMETVMNLGSKRGREGHRVQVFAPLVQLDKAGIVREGLRTKAPLHLTWSCYEGRELACGQCDACRLRLDAFRQAGVRDSITYAPEVTA